MHELSLVQSIFSSLEAEISQEELTELSKIELQIGLLANVEPLLLQNAFSAFQETNPQYAQVDLDIDLIPIRIRCESCNRETSVEKYVFKCSHCSKPSRNIISGEELLIHKVHF